MFFFKRRKQERERLAREAHNAQQRIDQARNAQRRIELRKLLVKAERGEITIKQFYSLKAGNRGLLTEQEKDRWDSLRRQMIAKEEFQKQLPKLKRLQRSYRSAEGTYEEIEALRLFLIEYRHEKYHKNAQRLKEALGVDAFQVRDLLKQAVQTHYTELIARRHQSEQFEQLWKLISATKKSGTIGHTNTLGDLGVDRLSYPDDWNDLVARHRDTPSIKSFLELPDRGAGDVRLLAAEAVRTNDFTQAQIALAYCNNSVSARQAVGDVLTADLAKLVMERRAAMAEQAQLTE